jgi:hypothetical protein
MTQMTPGERVGPYVVVAELGRGGMGLVLRARHAVTGGEVALKVLDASLVDAKEVTRFDLEGKALAKVAGDGIVPVHAAGLDGRRRWIALGLMEGGSLRDRMKTSGAWPWERAVELVRGLATTLGRCHAAGIVHRDLKPENILFDGAGRAHVADFGLVRDLGAQALTLSGTIMGTPAYMAPEQLEGLRADGRADVWALAVILHELVAGERPWIGQQTVQLLARITANPRPRLAGRGAPPDLDGVLDRALSLDAERRHPDAAAFAAGLVEVLASQSPALLLARRAKSKQRRFLGLLALAALLAVLGAAAQQVTVRRQGLAALAAALDDDVARIDSWRGGLRAARCAGRGAPADDVAALEGATRIAEDRLHDPGAVDVRQASARARAAASRGRLELAVARGAAPDAATLAGLGVRLEDDAHLRLLAELAAPTPDPAVVEREVSLVLGALRSAKGEHATDLRLAAARGHLALGRAPSAISVLAPALAGAPTRGELFLGARSAGELCDDPGELERASLARVALFDPDAEELGAAALEGLLAEVARLAASPDPDATRRVELLVKAAWDFELDYRERWRQLEPFGSDRWPKEGPPNPFRPPERAARPPRTLVRPRHAPALRAALARLDASSDDSSTPAAALACELLAVADPGLPPPTTTWEKAQQLFERHTLEVQRVSASERAGLARKVCFDLFDRLRLGLPVEAGAFPPLLRTPLKEAANLLLAEDERDWAREALVCILELHDRRNYFQLTSEGKETRERERATLGRPLARLAASPLLSPAARAVVALGVAEYGMVHACDTDQKPWAEPVATRAPPWSYTAANTRRRRARVVAARVLLDAHRASASVPDLFDGVLAQVALMLGEAPEAERLARRALELTRLRDAGEPLEGRQAPPRSTFQLLPVTMRRVLVRALREQGRTAEAAVLEAADDTIRPR